MIFKTIIEAIIGLNSFIFIVKGITTLKHAAERKTNLLKIELSSRACASVLTGIKNLDDSAQRLSKNINKEKIAARKAELKRNFFAAAHIPTNCLETVKLPFEMMREGRSDVANFIYRWVE